MLVYGTVVKVIAGFYLGCTGIVTEDSTYVGDYVVDLRCEYKMQNTRIIDGFKVKLSESQLQVIETPRQ